MIVIVPATSDFTINGVRYSKDILTFVVSGTSVQIRKKASGGSISQGTAPPVDPFIVVDYTSYTQFSNNGTLFQNVGALSTFLTSTLSTPAVVIVSSTPNIATKICGEAVNSGQAVMIKTDGKAYVFNISNEANYGLYCGIAKQSGITGAPIDIYISGEAIEPGSGWVSGVPYYVASNGYLTATPVPSGIHKLVGIGSATDALIMSNEEEIIII